MTIVVCSQARLQSNKFKPEEVPAFVACELI